MSQWGPASASAAARWSAATLYDFRDVADARASSWIWPVRALALTTSTIDCMSVIDYPLLSFLAVGMHNTYFAFNIISTNHFRRVYCMWWPWKHRLNQRGHMLSSEPRFFCKYMRFRDLLDGRHDKNVSDALEKRCFGWSLTTEVYYRSTNPEIH